MRLVLLGQQLDDGLGQRGLLVLVQAGPDDGEEQHPEVVRLR